MALICDTGPLYAAMDRGDVDHSECAELLASATESILVPAPVVVELDWLAGRRLGPRPFAEFLSEVEDGGITVVELVRADYVRARQLIAQYADLRLGFVDAAVIAVVERFAERKLATLDHRHFRVVRPRHTQSLALLPA